MSRVMTHAMPVLTALLGVVLASPVVAQPRVGQDGTFLIRGGTVVTGAGQTIPNGSVLIRDGRIAEVGTNVQAPAGAITVDATDRFVYPGMIDAYTPLGLTEIGGINTMNLRSELGEFNPHMRAVVALNVDSELLGVTRANGVTNVLSTPSSGIISGQAALIHTAGWTWEDLAAATTAAFVVNWPREPSFRFGPSPSEAQQRTARERVEENIRELKDWFMKAREYDAAREAGSTHWDQQYESMRPLVRGEVPALVSADSEEQIRGVIALADSFDIPVIVYGGSDAWKVAELLAEKQVPVVLGSIQSTPAADAPYDALYAQPGVLHRAGVKFAFSTGGASNARHVPYHAALAVAYGLPADAALRALTLAPAEMFGVGDQLGSIEPGKLANLFITTGDPLDIRSQVTEVFIKGRLVPPDDRHVRFYEKYNARPRPTSGN
jgi:imidazolonepropionase-like amidohydrolase